MDSKIDIIIIIVYFKLTVNFVYEDIHIILFINMTRINNIMKNVFNKWSELITEQAQGTSILELVKKKIGESKANNKDEWNKTFNVHKNVQNDIANAIIKRFGITKEKQVERLNIYTLENNPTTGQFKSDPNFPNKVLLKYEDEPFKSYELADISKKIYDKYIEDAGNKKVAWMINNRKEDKSTGIHSRHIFNSTQKKVIKDQFSLRFWWNFQVAKIEKRIPDPNIIRIDTKIDSGFPFNRITPRDSKGTLAPDLQNTFRKIKEYLDINNGSKLDVNIESSASKLPATNFIVSGFTSPDHSYGNTWPANKWTTIKSKRVTVENGNAFLAKGRGESTITELATFLNSKAVKQQDGKYEIKYGESIINITMTSAVNGIEYVKGGSTPSSAYAPFQYVKITAEGTPPEEPYEDKNQITSWRLTIGAQMK
jgi:hypothetical protein